MVSNGIGRNVDRIGWRRFWWGLSACRGAARDPSCVRLARRALRAKWHSARARRFAEIRPARLPGRSPRSLLRRRPAWTSFAPPVWNPAAPSAASAARPRRRPARAREPPLKLPDLAQQLVHRKERRTPRKAHERHFKRGARLPAADNIIE